MIPTPMGTINGNIDQLFKTHGSPKVQNKIKFDLVGAIEKTMNVDEEHIQLMKAKRKTFIAKHKKKEREMNAKKTNIDILNLQKGMADIKQEAENEFHSSTHFLDIFDKIFHEKL